MRPKTLAGVADLTARGEAFDASLAEFLDEFYATPQAHALLATPRLLAPGLGEAGRVADAYLAATAEHLATVRRFPVPAWTASDARALHRPWFASPLAALRTVLILESPVAFRSRNLFISERRADPRLRRRPPTLCPDIRRRRPRVLPVNGSGRT
jgi:hypothetical protein